MTSLYKSVDVNKKLEGIIRSAMNALHRNKTCRVISFVPYHQSEFVQVGFIDRVPTKLLKDTDFYSISYKDKTYWYSEDLDMVLELDKETNG